jgi:hypothetical protein
MKRHISETGAKLGEEAAVDQDRFAVIEASGGDRYYVTAEDYAHEAELTRICREHSVAFLSIRGVTHKPLPTAMVVYETVRAGRVREFQSMCEHDPTTVTYDIGGNRRPVHVSSAFPEAFPVLEWLLESHRADIDIDAKSATGRSPLDYAMIMLVPQAVRALIYHGCDTEHLAPAAVPPFDTDLAPRLPRDALERMTRMLSILPPHMLLRWDTRWLELCAVARPAVPDAAQPKPVADLCVVCMERPPDTFVVPCHHCVVCSACSDKLKHDERNAHHCVYCKQPIEGIYLAGEDRMQD